jgi:hypothetical protein
MTLTIPQSTVANDKSRFKVLIAGRRFGKTHLCVRELARNARHPNKKILYLAPTYGMARSIVWDDLKARLLQLNWLKKKNENDLSIELKNGSKIFLKGTENFDSLRGGGYDFVVFDEFADINKKVWTHIIRPALADREGSALFCGTPKGTGNWSYDLFTNAKFEKDWNSWQYTTIQGGQVSKEELESAKQELDLKIYKQEFEASFESYDGVIYHNWDRAKHVREYKFPIPSIIHVGIDFNTSPMSAIAFAGHGANSLWAIEEFVLYNSNTHQMAQQIKNKYPTQRIIIYPDPSGRQRKTSAMGLTDISILHNEGFIVKARKASIPVRDRINAVNSLLLNADKQVRLLVDPKCKMTVKAMEKMAYKEGTNVPDLNNDYNHISDALGYAIEYQYPVAKNRRATPQPTRWAVGMA